MWHSQNDVLCRSLEWSESDVLLKQTVTIYHLKSIYISLKRWMGDRWLGGSRWKGEAARNKLGAVGPVPGSLHSKSHHIETDKWAKTRSLDLWLLFFFTCFFVALSSFLVGDSFCPLPLRQRSERTFCGQRAHSMAEGSLQKNTYIPLICHFLHNRNLKPRNFALESV